MSQPAELPTAGLRVGALLYRVSRHHIEATWVAPDGSRETSILADTATDLPRLEQLRRELANGMALACGNAPLMGEFAAGWGRDLLPEPVLTAPPDVLVIVPHAVMHDVPLHLVSGPEDLLPLGCRSGLCYASSMSLFTRCASRNAERARRDPTTGRRQPRAIADSSPAVQTC